MNKRCYIITDNFSKEIIGLDYSLRKALRKAEQMFKLHKYSSFYSVTIEVEENKKVIKKYYIDRKALEQLKDVYIKKNKSILTIKRKWYEYE